MIWSTSEFSSFAYPKVLFFPDEIVSSSAALAPWLPSEILLLLLAGAIKV
jgi:hypothetical protein